MDLMVLGVQGSKILESAGFYDKSASRIYHLAMRDPGDASRSNRLVASTINCISPTQILQVTSTYVREGPVQQTAH